MGGQLRYYMNNPCVVVRVISTTMIEIQLNTHFAESVEGSQWCDGCHLGGTVSHTCEEYDNVIDIIQDEEHSIFCIVESRLLHKEPIELVQYKCILGKIEELKTELRERQELQKEWNNDIKARKARLELVNRDIEAMQIVQRSLAENFD